MEENDLKHFQSMFANIRCPFDGCGKMMRLTMTDLRIFKSGVICPACKKVSSANQVLDGLMDLHGRKKW